jgi:hypothetical protein
MVSAVDNSDGERERRGLLDGVEEACDGAGAE